MTAPHDLAELRCDATDLAATGGLMMVSPKTMLALLARCEQAEKSKALLERGIEDVQARTQQLYDEARAAGFKEGVESATTIGVWSEEERDGMAAAFKRAEAKHGFYETLFAVGAWLLRYRKERALAPEPQR